MGNWKGGEKGCSASEGGHNYHACIASVAVTLQNKDKNCWWKCGQKSGKCSWCGSGKCCRKNWNGGENGCSASEGGDNYHSCVADDSSPPPSYTPSPTPS